MTTIIPEIIQETVNAGCKPGNETIGYLAGEISRLRSENKRYSQSQSIVTPTNNNFEHSLHYVLKDLQDMLLEKNKAYGDSALNPIRIFAKSDNIEQIRVRIDDKIARLKNLGDKDTEDSEIDLIGYLIILRIAKNAKRERELIIKEYPEHPDTL